MLNIHLRMTGKMASGKTRATKAIEKALATELGDKPYKVHWEHELEVGRFTESGAFEGGPQQ